MSVRSKCTHYYVLLAQLCAHLHIFMLTCDIFVGATHKYAKNWHYCVSHVAKCVDATNMANLDIFMSEFAILCLKIDIIMPPGHSCLRRCIYNGGGCGCVLLDYSHNGRQVMKWY